jgi:phosphoribosylglycinamide formyltransferase-1
VSDHETLSPLRLAVLISGGGTTLANLLDRIELGLLDARVEVVISSTAKARGLQIAERAGVRALTVDPRDYTSIEAYSDAVFAPCRESNAHLIVMAGFLKMVAIPKDFEGRVVNIHPSLIPSFCGHGFYGLKVHQAVLDYGAKVTGCTVHFVDQQYDHGPIILQRVVPVEDSDTAETLAARVFQAECEAYPAALRLYAAGKLRLEGRHVRTID